MKSTAVRFAMFTALLSSALYCDLALTETVDEGVAAIKRGDFEDALKIFQPLANNGDASAQTYVGVLYADGLGVSQDDKEALRWYKLAAAQGMATAQYQLGNIYKRGDGVAIDSVRAHMWFDLSAAQGERFSVIERDSIAKRLTSQQIAEAQKLARECLARKYQDC